VQSSPTSSFANSPARKVELGAGPIAYREFGAGPPLLFVHGLLVNGLLWRKVVPQLSDRFRCIVPDWPLGSHLEPMRGDADLTPPGLARIIAEFVDALSLDGATIVANDTGGALSQIACADFPQRVGGLVLTPCDMFDNFLPPMFKPLQAIGSTAFGVSLIAQLMRPRAVRNSPLGFGLLAKRGVDAAASDEYVRAVLSSAGVRRDVAKVLRGISPRHTQAAAEKLRGFDRPVLLAWCDDSRVFPVEHARRMAAQLPHARVEVIADSYAFVPEDQPAQLAALIGDFMTESAAR